MALEVCEICEFYNICYLYKFLHAESFSRYISWSFCDLLKEGVFDGFNKCFSKDFLPLVEFFYILFVLSLLFNCLL